MNFSSLAGCPQKARFGLLMALPKAPSVTGSFVYNSLLNGSYKSIIESQLPENTKIIFDMSGHQIKFSHKGFMESVHAVAVLDEPTIIKVVLVNEEVIAQTLDIKYPSVNAGLQAMMNHSDIGNKPKINKALVLAINTEDFSVIHIPIEADTAIQESIDAKIDVITDLSHEIESADCKECPTCNFKPICSNETLPVISCSTCAFYRINESTCALNNNQGIRCDQHLYNPVVLPNHSHKSADVQHLFIEYNSFVNSNNPVSNLPVLSSDEMLESHKFDKERILDDNLHSFKNSFGAKPV